MSYDLEKQITDIALSMGPRELNKIYCRLRTRPEARLELQKQLLALSFGFHQAGATEGANNLFNSAGFIAGFGERANEDLAGELSTKKEGI